MHVNFILSLKLMNEHHLGRVIPPILHNIYMGMSSHVKLFFGNISLIVKLMYSGKCLCVHERIKIHVCLKMYDIIFIYKHPPPSFALQYLT
jgi:hypothetical protein